MNEYEKTEDGRHFIVNGRKWRATDPNIPATLKAQLVAVLMDGRREVKAAKQKADKALVRSARNKVNDAKIALGERGRAWWLPFEKEALKTRIESAIRTLLRHRDQEKSICPSEAARVVAAPDRWRDQMPLTREVAIELAKQKVLKITRKEQTLDPDDLGKGHIRLRRGENFESLSQQDDK